MNSSEGGANAFDAAWEEAVAAFGEGFRRYFRPESKYGVHRGRWTLVPDISAIREDYGVWSGGERRYMAGLVSFYNGTIGTELFNQGGDDNGFLAVAASVDARRRSCIAQLLMTYDGW